MRFRWLVLGVFVLSSALNYLDRQLLPALPRSISGEFGLTERDLGLVFSAFSITYAAVAPFAGLFIDRVGLNRGISVAVGLWGLAGAATGLVGGLAGLLAARTLLGVAQAAGVPAAGKAISLFLKPEERALGHAVSQIGLATGAMLAPPLAIWIAGRYGWRSAFLWTGLATLAWVPLWNWVARGSPRNPGASSGAGSASAVLRDRRMWIFVIANMLSMTVYSLWSNWTTVYLVRQHGLEEAQTRWYASLPPIFFMLGGLLGGTLSLAAMRRGAAAIPARLRVCLLSAAAMLATALVPWMPSPAWGIAAIGFCSFWAASMSVNLYSMPLDAFGSARAAFAVSLLTSAYGAMQAVFSPLAGALIGPYGFGPVCLGVACLPLIAWRILRIAERAH